MERTFSAERLANHDSQYSTTPGACPRTGPLDCAVCRARLEQGLLEAGRRHTIARATLDECESVYANDILRANIPAARAEYEAAGRNFDRIDRFCRTNGIGAVWHGTWLNESTEGGAA